MYTNNRINRQWWWKFLSTSDGNLTFKNKFSLLVLFSKKKRSFFWGTKSKELRRKCRKVTAVDDDENLEKSWTWIEDLIVEIKLNKIMFDAILEHTREYESRIRSNWPKFSKNRIFGEFCWFNQCWAKCSYSFIPLNFKN